jgi:hypothetical protein
MGGMGRERARRNRNGLEGILFRSSAVTDCDLAILSGRVDVGSGLPELFAPSVPLGGGFA